MKRCKISYLALALAVMATPAYAQNLLTNGAFDTFSTATAPDPTTAPGWDLAINTPDGTDRSAQFQTGFANANNTGAGGSQAPGTGAGVWFRAFEGDQGGVGDPLADATLTQSVVAAVAGDYRLDFVAGIEGIANFSVQDFSVSLASSGTGGSAAVDLVAESGSITDGNIGGAASNNKGGTPFSIDLLGVSVGDTLTVTGRMLGGVDSGTNPQSGFLDNFSLTVIPEPTSLALAGIGIVALLSSRRKR